MYLVDTVYAFEDKLVELGAVLLDSWHLHIWVAEIGEAVTPVGFDDRLAFADIEQVEDTIAAPLRLDNEFYAILTDGNGEVRTGGVEGGSCLCG